MAGRSLTLRLLANVAGAFASRAVNLVTAFLTVPLAVAGLGTHDYGLFAVILSAATFVAYSDFGMGLAMVNPIAIAEVRGDHAETRRVIGETWALLLIISTVILVVGTLVVSVLSVTTAGGLAVMTPWFVFVPSIAIGLPAGVTQRVLFALQRNYEANMWMSAAKIGSLVLVFLAYHMGWGLSAYIFAMLGVPALFGWVNTFYLFRFSRPDLLPRLGASVAVARRLLPEGLRYTVLQIGPYLETGFDVILVGTFLGAAQTTSYDLITRAFNYVPALATIGIMPLWPAITAALAGGHAAWANQVKRMSSIALLVVTTIPALVLAIYHPQALYVWTGHEVVYPYLVSLPLAFVAVSMSYLGLQNSVILAAGGPGRLYRLQIVFLVILMPAKIGALFFMGVKGLAIATALAYVLKYVFMFRILRSMKRDR